MTHRQQQIFEVQQTLTPQYHGKHKFDDNFSCSHQEPEQSHIQGCPKDGLLVKTTRTCNLLHVKKLPSLDTIYLLSEVRYYM